MVAASRARRQGQEKPGAEALREWAWAPALRQHCRPASDADMPTLALVLPSSAGGIKVLHGMQVAAHWTRNQPCPSSREKMRRQVAAAAAPLSVCYVRAGWPSVYCYTETLVLKQFPEWRAAWRAVAATSDRRWPSEMRAMLARKRGRRQQAPPKHLLRILRQVEAVERTHIGGS